MNNPRIDYNDWTFGREISKRIAFAMGWKINPRDENMFMDPGEKEEDPNWYLPNTDVPPSYNDRIFHPMENPEVALLAISRLARRRRARFRMECSPEGEWMARFELSGPNGNPSGYNRVPTLAMCEAMVKLGDIPDLRLDFS